MSAPSSSGRAVAADAAEMSLHPQEDKQHAGESQRPEFLPSCQVLGIEKPDGKGEAGLVERDGE